MKSQEKPTQKRLIQLKVLMNHEALKEIRVRTAASRVFKKLRVARQTSAAGRKPLCEVAARSGVAVKGQLRPEARGRGQDATSEGGAGARRRLAQALCACAQPQENQQAPTRGPADPRQPGARRRWAQARRPGKAPPEEPRRRHAKSQNGCPEDARSAPPVSREPAAAGAGEGAPGRQSPLASRSLSGRSPSAPQGAGPSPSPTPGARAPVPQPALAPPPPPARYLQFGPLHLPVRPLHFEPSPLVLDVVQDPRDGVLLRPGQLGAWRGPRHLGGRGTPAARRSVRSRRKVQGPPGSLLRPGRGRHPRAAATAAAASGQLVHCVRGPGRGSEPDAGSCGEGRGRWPRADGRAGAGRERAGEGGRCRVLAADQSRELPAAAITVPPPSARLTHSLWGKGGGNRGGREGGGGTGEERRRAAARPPACSLAGSRTARRVADASAAARRITK